MGRRISLLVKKEGGDVFRFGVVNRCKSFGRASLDTSRYGYVHYWRVKRLEGLQNFFKLRHHLEKAMHMLSCMINSTRPPIHLDFYERKKARSRREHTGYSTKQIFYICRWLCTQKNARQFTSQEIRNIQ